MMTNISKIMFFVFLLGSSSAVYANPDGKQQKMPMDNMMNCMKGGMSPMMEKMHIRMGELIEQLEKSPQRDEMMKMHKDMTEHMGKMKMMHKDNAPDMKAPKSEKKHDHKY